MNSLRLSVLSNIAGAGWLAVLQVAVVPLYLSLLGVEAYGLIGFHLTLVGLLRILDLGLGTTMNREMARYSVSASAAAEARDFARTLEVAYWVVGLAIGALVWAAAPSIARHWLNPGRLPEPLVVDALRAMAILVALQWPLGLYQGGLLGLERQVALNVVKVGMATLGALWSVAALWIVSRSVLVFFTVQIAVATLHVVVMARLLWRSLPHADRRPRVQLRLLGSIHRFALGLSAISGLSVILTQGDKLLLSRMLTLEQFGFYALASVLGTALATVNAPVFNSVFPRFSALVASGENGAVVALFRRASRFVAVATVPAAIVVALFSFEIIAAWTGDASAAHAAGPVVAGLVLGAALNGLMYLPYALQLAHGRTGLALGFNLVLVAGYLPLLVLATSSRGPVGAAWTWTAVNAVYVLAGVPITTRRLLDTSARSWFVDLATVSCAALAVAVAWRLAMAGRAPSSAMSVAVVAAAFATATSVAAAALPEVRRFALNTFWSAIGRPA